MHVLLSLNFKTKRLSPRDDELNKFLISHPPHLPSIVLSYFILCPREEHLNSTVPSYLGLLHLVCHFTFHIRFRK